MRKRAVKTVWGGPWAEDNEARHEQMLLCAFESMLGYVPVIPPALDIDFYWGRKRWEYGSKEYKYLHEVPKK